MNKKIFNALLIVPLAIALIATGCSSDESNPVPEVSFEVLGGDRPAPLNVEFINQSENADSYEWNFGDGNTSTEENPTHTFSEPGHFDVSLTAHNDEGSNSATQKVYVYGEIVSWTPTRISVTKDQWESDENKVVYALLRHANNNLFEYWGEDGMPSVDPISFTYGDTYTIQNFNANMNLNINNGQVILEIRWAPEGQTIYPNEDTILFQHTLKANDVIPSNDTDPYPKEIKLEEDGVIVNIKFNEAD